MCVDGDALYWLESRANEEGRGVIVKSDSSNGQQAILKEVLPPHISVRTKVHEYGCGDFIVDDRIVYFSDARDYK